MLKPIAVARRWTRCLGGWAGRYLPSELAGASAAVVTATAVAAAGFSPAVAAIAATVAEIVGFYGVMAVRLWREQRRRRDAGRPPGGAGRTATLVARQLLAEFGVAEVADSLLIRPVALAAGPLLTGATASGTLLGKLLADLIFYTVTIVSYERRCRLVGGDSADVEVRLSPAEVPESAPPVRWGDLEQAPVHVEHHGVRGRGGVSRGAESNARPPSS